MKIEYLRRSSERAYEVLNTGTWDDQHAALPFDVISEAEGESIAFRIESKSSITRPPFAMLIFLATRAYSLTASISPGLAVLVWGYVSNRPIDWPLAMMALAGGLCLHLAVNLLNDVEDHFKLIDLPKFKGGSQVIQRGWISAQSMRRLGVAFLIVGGLLGATLLILLDGKSPWILWAGILGILGAWGYSSRPFGLKYRALGDLAVFALMGPCLTAGYAAASFGSVTFDDLAIGSLFGWLACGLLHVNNLEDIPIDVARGARTLASSLGFKRARYGYLVFSILSVVSVIMGTVFGTLPVMISIWMCASWWLNRSLAFDCILASGPESSKLHDSRLRAAKLHLVQGLSLILAMLSWWAFH